MSKSIVLLLVLVFLTGLCLILSVPVKAASKTIVVPDDFPTISSAIENALEGDTIFVKKGLYQEQILEINKPLLLVGEDPEETILKLDPPLVEIWLFYSKITVPVTAITINTCDFKLSGFAVNMPAGMSAKEDIAMPGGLIAKGDRIELADNKLSSSLKLSGALLNITNNEIVGSLIVDGSNQTVANNSIIGSLESKGSFNRIIENAIDGEVNLRESSFNLIVGNSFSTIYMEHSDSNFISCNAFSCLWVGFYGHTCSNNTVSNNTVSKNRVTGPGLWGILMGAGSYNVFHDNLICNYAGSHDGYGIAMGGNHLVAEHNTFYRNILMNNSRHVSANWEILGAGNFWDNGEVGNYWDDYTGTDSNGDGIGDVPYMVKGCKWDDAAGGYVSFVFGQDNYPLMAPFDIDSVISDLPEEATPSWTPSHAPQLENTKPFLTALVIAASAIVVFAATGLLVYFKKHPLKLGGKT